MFSLNVRDNAMSDDYNDNVKHWDIKRILDIHEKSIYERQIIEYILQWNIYNMNEEIFSSKIWII